MKRAKIYKTAAPAGWEIITDVYEVGGQVSFDFDPTNYMDASGNINVIIQTSTDGITWTDITTSTSSTVYETEVTNAYVKIDQDGLIANNGATNTAIIDKNGNVTIVGNITATSGTIGGWNINGSALQSSNSSIVLNPTSNLVTIGNISQIRYVRDWLSESSASTSNIWTEIKVMQGSTNLAAGKTATGSIVFSNANFVTDGDYSTIANYVNLVGGTQWIQIDLGSVQQVDYVHVWHYYSDGRTFHGTKTEVSVDGVVWIPIFDSAVSGEYIETSAGKIMYLPNSNNNVTLSTSSGIIAKRGTVGGWTLNNSSLSAGSLTITGGASPSITVGSNITLNATKLTILNGAIDITAGPSNSVKIDSTGIKATAGTNYALLDNTGLKVVGGAVNITTNDNGAGKKLVLNSTGIIAYKDANNRVEFDADGVRCIKAGVSIGSALTPDGIIGTLLTDQSVAGSKFDKTAPAVPVITTGAGNTYAYVEQTATSEFVNIKVKWAAVADTDREGYKVYLKEGTSGDTSFLYIPVAVVSKTQESGGSLIYDIRNVKSNTIYCVKVTAYDVTGNESDLASSVAVQIAGIKDTIAPKAPAAITVLPGFKMNAVKWTAVIQNTDNSSCVDLDYYVVERSTDGTNYTAIAKVYTDMIIDKDVNYDVQYKYRVKAIDLSGNASTYVTSEYVIPSRVDRSDIVVNSITTELLKIGSIVKSINREETTLFHFDGTLMSTQGLTPYTDSNKVIHQNGFFKREAKFGASLSIEEDTENLIATVTDGNANLRSTSNNWIVGADCTFKTTNGVDGIDDGYFEVGYVDGLRVEFDVIPGKVYNISLYAKKVTANSRIRADITPLNGTVSQWTSAASPGAGWDGANLERIISSIPGIEWTRYNNIFTVPLASNTTRVSLHLRQYSDVDIVAVDSIQVEQRAYATSFFNGIKKEGYVDYYAPGLINHLTGVVAFWAKNIIGWHNVVDNDHPDDSPYVDNWFIWGKETDANKIMAKYNRQNSTLTVTYGTTALNYIFPTEILNDDWIHFAYEWHGGLQTLYINGVNVATSTGAVIGSPVGELLRLGYFPRMNGTTVIEEDDPVVQNKRARASLMFDEFRIDKVVRDADEITSWYNQDAAFYDAAAQIDADSQNISAANASVTINNEGITVRDGKIAVESEDGKILLQNGRLQVNGLDVGVPQSDNSVFNGNFTIVDTSESISDAYVYDKGIARFGAKYWSVNRTSPPKYENAILSVAWDRIYPASFMSYEQIFALYKQSIDPEVRAIAKKNPNDYTSYVFDEGLEDPTAVTLKAAFIATPSLKTACLGVSQSIVGDAIKGVVRTDAQITTQADTLLKAQGIDVATGANYPYFLQFTATIAQTVIASISNFVEYQVYKNIKPLGFTDVVVADCQTAGRNAINLFVDNYATNTQTSIVTELTPKNTGVPGFSAFAIPGTVQVVEGFKPFMKMGIEQQVDNTSQEKYNYLLSAKFGLLSYNDLYGTRIDKACYTNDTGEIYELTLDLTKSPLDLTIDPATGLPPMSSTPITYGNTSYYVYPFTSLYGRLGYIELGVQGAGEELIQVTQPVGNLVTYTDGTSGRNANYKQHTFSFNSSIKESADHVKTFNNSGKVEFEVEELVPLKPLDRNPVTGVVPTDPSNPTMPLRKANYEFVNGQFKLSPACEFLALDPLIMDTDDKYVLMNTVGYSQGITFGNADFDMLSGSYSINTIKDALTINCWIQYGASFPNGVAFSHPIWGDGYVKNSVLHLGATSVDDIDETKSPAFIVKKENGVSFIETFKAGDFCTFSFASYTKCDVTFSIYQKEEYGVAAVMINKELYKPADMSFVYPQQTELTIKDFAAGKHDVTVINVGQKGISSSIENTGMSLVQAKTYDWEKIKYTATSQDPAELAFAASINNNVDNKVILTKYIDGKYYYIKPTTALDKIATEGILYENGKWNTTYITPKYANSLKLDGTPLYDSMIPIKYKVNVKMMKDDSDNLPSNINITGIQAELGTNPSYTRITYGENSIAGYMIQPYDKEMWVISGVQTRHLEEHFEGYPGETGIQSRHIGNEQVISTKIAQSAVVNEHLAKSNITFEKTRIRTLKLSESLLTTSSYIPSGLSQTEIDTINGEYLKYISVFPTSRQADEFFIPYRIQEESEFLIKNGQILDVDDDYTFSKHLGFVSAEDIYNIAVLYGVIPDGGTERVLTDIEVAQLTSTIQTTNLYNDPVLYSKINTYDALFYTKIKVLSPVQTVNGYKDKYKIQFWEEL